MFHYSGTPLKTIFTEVIIEVPNNSSQLSVMNRLILGYARGEQNA